jgi:hypothetical protein
MRFPSWMTWGVLATVYAAGVYVTMLAVVTRRLNGLGRRFNRVVALLTLWADTEEKRKQLADYQVGK